MSGIDLMGLAPLLTLTAGAVLLMLQIAIRRAPTLSRSLSLAIYIVTLFVSVQAADMPARQITPLLLADSLALLFCAAFAIAAALTVMLSTNGLVAQSDQPDEFFLLLVLATLGACVLVYANHVASLLLGLELLSISLYALVAYPTRQQLPVEAAIKYLVLSGAATAILLFGFALLYAGTGALAFSAIGAGLGSATLGSSTLVFGAAMVLVGLGFKLAAAPMHLWTPDVYQGAPGAISGFLASVAKAAPFVVLLRLFNEADLYRFPALIEATAALAILSMLIGNLLALLQNNIKRMLAYSSIAHIGYVLIVFSVAADPAQRALASEAAAFYLLAYLPTTIAAFAVVTVLADRGAAQAEITLQSMTGLFWRQPLLAALMLVAMLSLAGIPLTAGFIGKLYLYAAAVAGAHWLLLALLIVGTGLGIYYYLRVIYEMSRAVDDRVAVRVASSSATRALGLQAVALGLIAAILFLGILPEVLMHYLSGVF
jgi:NADH-quinone oxidoreductase subunit N